VFFSHASTNLPIGLEETHPFDINHHQKFPRKQKEIHPQGSFGHWLIFSLFHRWIMLILGYVVHLEVAFIVDGGDWTLISRQGFVAVEQ
jgi:hypothetical protein